MQACSLILILCFAHCLSGSIAPKLLRYGSVSEWVSDWVYKKESCYVEFLGKLSSSHGCWLTGWLAGGCLAGWLRTFNKLAHKPWGVRWAEAINLQRKERLLSNASGFLSAYLPSAGWLPAWSSPSHSIPLWIGGLWSELVKGGVGASSNHLRLRANTAEILGSPWLGLGSALAIIGSSPFDLLYSLHVSRSNSRLVKT